MYIERQMQGDVNTNTFEPKRKQHGNKKKRRGLRRKNSIFRMLRQVMKENPNLNTQLITIMITLASGKVPVDRGIDDLVVMMEKIRNVTEIVDKTMQSVKIAAEAPGQIRQLFE